MLSLITLAIIDWMQFGLAGATFITLCTMLLRSQKQSREKDKDVATMRVDNDKIISQMRIEMWAELEKRDMRFIDLQEKTLKSMYKMVNGLERLAGKIQDGSDNDEQSTN